MAYYKEVIPSSTASINDFTYKFYIRYANKIGSVLIDFNGEGGGERRTLRVLLLSAYITSPYIYFFLFSFLTRNNGANIR